MFLLLTFGRACASTLKITKLDVIGAHERTYVKNKLYELPINYHASTRYFH